MTDMIYPHPLAPNSPDRPIIDPAVLAGLRADLSEPLFQELLALFLEQGQQRAIAIEQAIAGLDFAALANETHAFKGETGTFGAMQLAALVSRVNSLCHQPTNPEAFAAAAAIKDAWGLLAAELKNHVGKPA